MVTIGTVMYFQIENNPSNDRKLNFFVLIEKDTVCSRILLINSIPVLLSDRNHAGYVKE